MKKVFGSLAILAIVVGVTSAFTTKAPKVTNSFQAWHIKQNTLIATPTNAAADVEKRGTVLASASSQFSIASLGSCTPDDQYICVALIKYVDNTPQATPVVDFKLGDSPYNQ